MNMNEAETRYELIDPVLRAKGYQKPYIRLETPAPVEPVGAKGRRRKGPGKTDYLICVETPRGPAPYYINFHRGRGVVCQRPADYAY
jgi:type I restriction enzyme R subunit